MDTVIKHARRIVSAERAAILAERGGEVIALACIILVGFGFGLGCIAIRLYDRSRQPDGLRCPHPMCRNILPRQGEWDRSTGEWAVESCPVCGGAVHKSGSKGE